MVEPCESYHPSHPTPCFDCKKRDERRHQLEARLADAEKRLAEYEKAMPTQVPGDYFDEWKARVEKAPTAYIRDFRCNRCGEAVQPFYGEKNTWTHVTRGGLYA